MKYLIFLEYSNRTNKVKNLSVNLKKIHVNAVSDYLKSN